MILKNLVHPDEGGAKYIRTEQKGSKSAQAQDQGCGSWVGDDDGSSFYSWVGQDDGGS